jgi:hypothetical protein
VAEREVDFDYDGSGRLATVTDPLSRQVKGGAGTDGHGQNDVEIEGAVK